MLLLQAARQSPQPLQRFLKSFISTLQGGGKTKCGRELLVAFNWLKVQEFLLSPPESHLRRYAKHLLARNDVRFIEASIMTIYARQKDLVISYPEPSTTLYLPAG